MARAVEIRARDSLTSFETKGKVGACILGADSDLTPQVFVAASNSSGTRWQRTEVRLGERDEFRMIVPRGGDDHFPWNELLCHKCGQYVAVDGSSC